MATVSVVIPLYNCRDYIGLAVESVLGQTFRDTEIIVVDDGSTDRGAEMLWPYLSRPAFHYLHQQNRGLPAARNAGAQRSEAEYVVFVDADDEIAPNAVELMLAALNRSGASWCITDIVKMIDGTRSVRRTEIPDGNPFYAILRSDFPCRAFMFRRRDFLEVGMYDEAMKVREDWEFHIRMLEAGKRFVYVNEPLYWYRWRQGSITTARKAEMLRYTERIIYKHHRRLAETDGHAFRSIYAESLWELGREYIYVTRDYRRALHCLFRSILAEPSSRRVLHPVVHHLRKHVSAA